MKEMHGKKNGIAWSKYIVDKNERAQEKEHTKEKKDNMCSKFFLPFCFALSLSLLPTYFVHYAPTTSSLGLSLRPSLHIQGLLILLNRLEKRRKIAFAEATTPSFLFRLARRGGIGSLAANALDDF